MKTVRLTSLVALFLFWQPAAIVNAAPQKANRGKLPEMAASSQFEPLDRWKAAVISGDKAALAAFYTQSPPAGAKTPQGETHDPAEEATFWSSLRSKGLNRFDIKVLEVKNLQPGAKAFVLRCEVKLQTPAGEKSDVISGVQVWLQQAGDWRIVSTKRSDLEENGPRRLPEPAKPNIQLYDDPKETPGEIAAALTAAAKDHKRVLLVFGGNWCYDCHVLDAAFHSKEIAPLVNENYHVVHVNVGDYDKNLDLAKKYEIPLEKGVPSLAVLDPDGKLVVSQKKGEFESTTRIGPENVIEFLKYWKPQHAGLI
jgi:thioredoxin 1